MFVNWKLRNRILVGYSIPVVLFVGLAVFVYFYIAKLSQVFQQVEVTQNVLFEGDVMTLNHAKTVEALRGYMLFQDEEFAEQYEKAIKLFNEAEGKAKTTIVNLEQQQRLQEMVQLKQQYYEFSRRLLSLSKQGKVEEALLLFQTQEGQGYIRKFREVSERFDTAENEILNSATAQAKAAIANLMAAVVLGALLCMGFSTIAAYGISSSIARTIERALSAIASSSTEIAATIEQQELTTGGQASAVNQTTTTMDELRASARQSASQSEASASVATQALSLTEAGTIAVGKTLKSQGILKEKVSAIAQQILQLREQTGQIGNIAKFVSDLANQTNMLALNAAVEAVRAGEHGKGFGVVASEIRKLADRSQTSAQKINTLVGDIQKAINSTVLVTQEGTKTVEGGVHIARDTEQALNGVRDAINQVVVSSQQISLNAQQQVSAIEQVVEAMNSINIGAKETATGIANTRRGTEQLNEAARDLKEMI